MTNPGILNERDAGLFVVERGFADLPAHQRVMER